MDSDGFTAYVDPWNEVMREEYEDNADLIISTHDHDDHFDGHTIEQLTDRDSMLIHTEESRDSVPKDLGHKEISAYNKVDVHNNYLQVRGVPAYNTNKYREPNEPYHPKGFCTGVLIDMDGVRFYHASDTDPIPEMEELADEDIDVAFLPVGGKYTMDQEEAIDAINMFQPEKVVPIHHGFIDGSSADLDKFEKDVKQKTDAEPLILEESSLDLH